MEENTITHNGLTQLELQGLHNVERNEFIFPDYTASYALDVDFNSTTPNVGGFDNNKVVALLTPRPVRVGGNDSTINGNKIYNNGAADRAMSVYATDCAITGNLLLVGASISLEIAAARNIVVGNAAEVDDAGTDNVLLGNRV
jgi:hypothetical protein